MKNPLLSFRTSLSALFLVAALIIGLSACSDKESTKLEQSTVLSQKPAVQSAAVLHLKNATVGTPDVQLTNPALNIIVGQNYDAGDLTVWEVDTDNNGVYDAFRIDLALNSASSFSGSVAIYIGTTLPSSTAPGQFPYQYPTPSSTTVSYTIPFSQCLPSYTGCTLNNIYILVHANINGQTGWAQGHDAPGANWAMYFTVDLKDVTPPVVTSPATVNLECESAVAPIEATDVCGTATVTLVSETAEGTCPKTITRTYTVSDGTNAITFVQTIIIKDNTAPVISGSIAETTIEGCNAPVAVTTVAALKDLGLTITDNCTTPLTVTSKDVVEGSCPKVVTRTYTVSDACGNSATAVQKINVTDTTAPTASNPAPINASCDNIPAPNTAVVTGAADNCGGTVSVTFAGDVVNGSGCSYTISRTYKVADACGNSVNVVQTINVSDKTAPVLSGQGANVTIACTATPAFTAPTATDNCSTATVSQLGSDLVETGTGYTRTTRTWIATDACGNVSAPVSQSITNNCGGFGGEGNPDPVASGTAWGFSSFSTPFNSFTTSNNWGWTNGLLAQYNTYKFTLYVGAGGNSLTKGTPVGDVTVVYGATSVTATFNVVSAVKITGAHLYVGKDKLPMKKTSYLSSPGQLGNNSGTINANTYTFTVTKLYSGTAISSTTGSIYVAAHADIVVK